MSRVSFVTRVSTAPLLHLPPSIFHLLTFLFPFSSLYLLFFLRRQPPLPPPRLPSPGLRVPPYLACPARAWKHPRRGNTPRRSRIPPRRSRRRCTTPPRTLAPCRAECHHPRDASGVCRRRRRRGLMPRARPTRTRRRLRRPWPPRYRPWGARRRRSRRLDRRGRAGDGQGGACQIIIFAERFSRSIQLTRRLTHRRTHVFQ